MEASATPLTWAASLRTSVPKTRGNEGQCAPAVGTTAGYAMERYYEEYESCLYEEHSAEAGRHNRRCCNGTSFESGIRGTFWES